MRLDGLKLKRGRRIWHHVRGCFGALIMRAFLFCARFAYQLIEDLIDIRQLEFFIARSKAHWTAWVLWRR
jgi:hypothetical protein